MILLCTNICDVTYQITNNNQYITSATSFVLHYDNYLYQNTLTLVFKTVAFGVCVHLFFS